MKPSLLSLVSLALTACTLARATPVDSDGLQTVLGLLNQEDATTTTDIFRQIEHVIEGFVEHVVEEVIDEVAQVSKTISDAEEKIEKWMENGRNYVKQVGHTCTFST